MGNADQRDAWLEAGDGHPWPLGSNCSIGRSPSNQIVLDDTRVSRRHAVVHRRDRHEYWLIDLGSGNGSFVNGLRIAMPTLLADGDRVRIGETVLTFRQGPVSARLTSAMTHSNTVIEAKAATCWMLVADIIGSTRLAASHTPAAWAGLVGAWAEACRRVVETHDGVINKSLGDGFLALWPRDRQATRPVQDAVNALLASQRSATLPFRIALHYGELLMGGARTSGEDSVSGLDLVLLFRMEKIAGQINRTFLCSEPAARRLEAHMDLEFAGEHVVSGFIDVRPRRFYGVRAK